MIIVGVGGGSGSGKTYLCSKIKEKLPEKTLVFSMDRYYKPFKDKDEFQRKQINWSHPRVLDWELMKEHLEKLRNGEEIEMPKYSFKKNTRVGYETKEPKDVTMIDGLHAFHNDQFNELMDLRIFIDPDPEIRAVRRVRRDVQERGRKLEFAARQFIEDTHPMHHEHVEPTKEHADLILDTKEVDKFIDAVTEKFVEYETAHIEELQKFVEKKL